MILESVGWLCVHDGRLLVVRSRGRDAFYLPGGKPEPGEDAGAALVREVREELGLELAEPEPAFTIEDEAHAAAGRRLRMRCFRAASSGEPRPAREIAELDRVTAADAARCAPAVRQVLGRLVVAGELDALAIRRLGPADAAAYRELRLAALRVAPDAFTSSLDEERARPLRWSAERLGAEGQVVLGAFRGDDLAGIAGLTVPARRQERHKGTVFGMAVDAAAGRRGIGRSLLLALIAEARARDVRQLALTVSEGNEAAERLYRSCGFTQWGREPRAVIVDGRPVAKLHMGLALDAA